MQTGKNKKLTKQKLQKNNFIELEFIGKVKDGEVFDTNIQEEAEKINLNLETRPYVICLGQGMILPAIDEFLIGKKSGKYNLELDPKKGFGERRRELIKTMPASVFKGQNVQPQPGMMFQFDNQLAKISAVSGGRVIVDFNNPLAGKFLIYELEVKRKIENLDEKIKSLIKFFFRKNLDYKLDNKKLIIQCESGFEKFVEIFKPKFKEILDLELEIKIEEKVEKKEQQTEQPTPTTTQKNKELPAKANTQK